MFVLHYSLLRLVSPDSSSFFSLSSSTIFPSSFPPLRLPFFFLSVLFIIFSLPSLFYLYFFLSLFSSLVFFILPFSFLFLLILILHYVPPQPFLLPQVNFPLPLVFLILLSPACSSSFTSLGLLFLISSPSCPSSSSSLVSPHQRFVARTNQMSSVDALIAHTRI